MATNSSVNKGSLLRFWPWVVIPVVALILPFIFTSGHSINLLNHMGVAIIFALAYNMLLGNTGLLSFGHAVYYGLGAFVAMHALRAINETASGLPLELLPLPEARHAPRMILQLGPELFIVRQPHAEVRERRCLLLEQTMI